MNEHMFDFIDYEETKHWWFVARTNLFKSIIESYNDDIENILDIGCGTGYFLSKIAPIAKNCYGVDPHTYKELKFDNIVNGTAENIPFDNNTFDVVTCFDVLEHVQNPQVAMEGILRVLKPGGFAVISVPANQWMYGPHDKENGHVRRFSKKEFESIVNPRFEIMKSTYFNTILYPVEIIIRLMEKMLNIRLTKDEAPNPKLNNILFKIFNSEKKWLLNHSFPFGISYLVVLRKRR